MRVIALNGAPRSGKNTLAHEMMVVGEAEGLAVCTVSIGRRIKEATHRAFDIIGSYNQFEDVKDEPSEAFGGATPRQAYIGHHEMVKAVVPHGDQHYAKQLAMFLLDLARDGRFHTAIVTDVGTEAELRALRVSGCDTLIRVHREGTEWDNREMVSPNPELGMNILDYDSLEEVNEIRSWIRVNTLTHMVG